MTWVVMMFVLIVSAVMQTVLPTCALLGQAKFPFLLGVVLYYALNRETGVMLAAALIAGFLQDALSPIPLGYSTICFCVIGWITGRFRNLIMTESVVTPVFFGAVAGTIVIIMFYALLVREGLIVIPLRRVVLKAVSTGVLGMGCTPIMFLLTGKLDRVVGNVRIAVEVEEDISDINGAV